jgi:Smg protein
MGLFRLCLEDSINASFSLPWAGAMFDILMFLFESYFNAGSYPDSDKLTIKLSAAGFDDDEIHQALTWLSGLEQLSPSNYPASIDTLGFRCFSAFEERLICSEGLHFISFWEQSGLISPIEREMIIDRAVALERENLPLDKIKLIALIVLWNQHEELDPLIVEDLLSPNNSAQLH